jgi:NAD(P) transhydrogenase subunit beta
MTLTTDYLLEILYLIAAVSFIVGLKLMSNPQTARRGNLVSAAGMLVAIVGTFFLYTGHHGHIGREAIKIECIAAAILCGGAIGWTAAKKVKMTAMPQLVSLFNGMGGACAALIGIREMHHYFGNVGAEGTIMTSIIIGGVSFSGSMVAFLKLSGILKKPLRLPHYNLVNNSCALVMIVVGVLAVLAAVHGHGLLGNVTLLAAFAYGILFSVPIGGADMPVVISLLNSCTGLAAASGGFLFHNQVMITGGILVGSAGTLLTVVMCKAMNRSLTSVIFGAFGEGASAQGARDARAKGPITEMSVADAAVLMNYSKKISIIPGYGLAVAQAQHIIHELEVLLTQKGVDVSYAIHPVAGRMPGHMNVLLAEASVEYDKLVEMDDANSGFSSTDVALVVGANDVVNPAANNDPSSPIFGMPILEVEKAAHTLIIKRSMNSGYAGIENELFYSPKTSMLFGDAKNVLTRLVEELKNL